MFLVADIRNNEKIENRPRTSDTWLTDNKVIVIDQGQNFSQGHGQETNFGPLLIWAWAWDLRFLNFKFNNLKVEKGSAYNILTLI